MGHEASGVEPDSHGVGGEEGACKASRVAENPGEVRHGVGGGVESLQGNSNPRVAEGPRGDKIPGDLIASQNRQGEDGWRQGGWDENPPTARATRRQGANGGDGATHNGQTAVLSAEMETTAGDGGEGPRPEHFDGADGARTKNAMHLCCEYENMASEAMERGQASAGNAAGEDDHGAMETCTGRRRAEEGDENPQRALLEQEPDGGEMEASPPTRTVARA